MHAILGVVAGTMLRRMRARLELAVACERHDVDVAALKEIKRGIHVPPEILAHLTLILS